MYKYWTLCICFSLVLAAPGLAQGGEETTISITPNPATTAQDLMVTVSSLGACPVFGPSSVEGSTLNVEIRENCPFATPMPFTLETTLDPLPSGSYDVNLILPDSTVLATTQLEVLDGTGCIPSATVLCLNNGRFQVEVEFSAPNGQSGEGQTLELTDDSGLFTFFDPDNVELLIKVLDACGTQFNSFWVFTAGLTNVQVDITVTDTETDQVKTYSNNQGDVFETVLDTAAFDTCP